MMRTRLNLYLRPVMQHSNQWDSGAESPQGQGRFGAKAIVWINGIPYAPLWGSFSSRRDRTRLRRSLVAGRRGLDQQVALDHAANVVEWRGASVRLTPHQFRIVASLVAANGTAVHRNQLLMQAWGHIPASRGDDLLRAHIAGVRKALRNVGLPASLIQNVWGGSYRLALPKDEAIFEAGS